jgi:hypothetical protein
MSNKQKPITQSSILICGPVRNVANGISDELEVIAAATSSFKSTFYLLIESDSNDETLKKLKEEEENRQNFFYRSMGNLTEKFTKRTQRIAFCRNAIVDEVKNNPKFKDLDYVMMADLDGMNHLITKEKIEQCWELDEDWDVLSANQGENYYDIWALRHPLWCPDDCWQLKEQLELIMSSDDAENLAVRSRQPIIDPRSDLIEVDSAFGGLAIYKKKAFISGRYEGLDQNNKEIADHVLFHKQLKQAGYRIFINPALINCAKYPEKLASISVKPPKFIFRIIKNLGIRFFGKKRFNKYLDQLKTY